MQRKTRSYSVVGRLCSSDDEARLWLEAIREADPAAPQDWGLAKILTGIGEAPSRLDKIRLPPPLALLKRLEGLLSERNTDEALRAVRAALRRQ